MIKDVCYVISWNQIQLWKYVNMYEETELENFTRTQNIKES